MTEILTVMIAGLSEDKKRRSISKGNKKRKRKKKLLKIRCLF